MKTEVLTPTNKRKTQQLVASTVTPKLGIKGTRKRRTVKFNVENVAPNNNNNKLSPGSRQTVLSEYFTSPDKSSPKETSPLVDCKSSLDQTVPTMVNVPRLLSQLLRARVVLSRMPASEIPNRKPVKTQRQPTTITPTTIPATKREELENGRIVQRYCMKCKTLELDGNNVTKRKACRQCGTTLLFVCTRCNVKHFIENRHMKKHFWQCNGQKADATSLDDVVIMFCAQCSFKSTYKHVMDRHKRNTGHKILKGERKLMPQSTKKVETRGDTAADNDIISTKVQQKSSNDNFAHKKEFIVQQKPNASKKGIKRYCTKCKTKFHYKKTGDDLSCRTCNTRLMYQCGKCKFKCGTYQFIYYHVRTKCYANIYRCPKCEYTVSFWHQIVVHLKTSQCRGPVSGVLSKKKKITKKS